MKDILSKKDIYLFEMYQDYYRGEDFHHHIYKQIILLFYNIPKLKTWYNHKYKHDVRIKKIVRLDI